MICANDIRIRCMDVPNGTDVNECKLLAFIGVYSRFFCNTTHFHSTRALSHPTIR